MSHPEGPPAPPKVLKVKITTSMHDRLHIARMLTGRPIASIVQDALAVYLRQHEARVNPGSIEGRAQA